jgi:hypothetical protein
MLNKERKIMMKLLQRIGFVFLLGVIAVVGCQRQEPSSSNKHTQLQQSESKESDIKAALAKLGPEDRKLAEAQQKCAVSGEPLGSMGIPVKVVLKEQPVFLCCKGCRDDALAEPDKTLANAIELKEKHNPK